MYAGKNLIIIELDKLLKKSQTKENTELMFCTEVGFNQWGRTGKLPTQAEFNRVSAEAKLFMEKIHAYALTLK